MRQDGPLSGGISFPEGKLGLVELMETGLKGEKEVPLDTRKYVYRIKKINKKEKIFYYKGWIDGQTCHCKIDTGSDISVIRTFF